MTEPIHRAIVTKGKPTGLDQARKSTLAERAHIPTISKEFWVRLGLDPNIFDRAINSIDVAEDNFKRSQSIGVFGEYQYPGLLPTPVMISLAKALAFFKEIPEDPRQFLKDMNSEHSLVPSTSDFIWGYGSKDRIEGVINSPREEVDAVVNFYLDAARESKFAYTLYGYTEVVIVEDEMFFKPKIRIVRLGRYNPTDVNRVKEVITSNAFKIAGGIDSFEGYKDGFFGDDSYQFKVQDIEFGKFTQEQIEELLVGQQLKIEEKQKTSQIDLLSSFPQIESLEGKFFHLLMAGN